MKNKLQILFFMLAAFSATAQNNEPKPAPQPEMPNTGNIEADNAAYAKAKAAWIAANPQEYAKMNPSTENQSPKKEDDDMHLTMPKYIEFDFENTNFMVLSKVESEDSKQKKEFENIVWVLDMAGGALYRQAKPNTNKAKFFKFDADANGKVQFSNCDKCNNGHFYIHQKTSDLVVIKMKEHYDDEHDVYLFFAFKK